MSEYKVTKEQRDLILSKKEYGKSLLDVLLEHDNGETPYFMRPLEGLDIAAVWLGIAEIKPDPVEAWEAYKAVWEGKTVLVEYNGSTSRLMNWQHVGSEFNIQEIKNKGTEFYIIEEDSK